MKYFFLILLFCSATINLYAQEEKSKKNYVIIKGEVHDYEYEHDGKTFPVNHEEIFVMNKYGSSEILERAAIKDNQVEIKFYYDEFKQYHITPSLGMAHKLLGFYPDADTIHFYIKSADEIYLTGGELTSAYFDKMNEMKSLFSKSFDQIKATYGTYTISFKDGEEVIGNPVAKEKMDSVRMAKRNYIFTTFPQNPGLDDYDLFFDNIWIPDMVKNVDYSIVMKAADYFNKHIQNPVYDSISTTLLTNLEAHYSMKEGSNYMNISANNIEGKPVQLNDFIGRDDYLLLDLFAYWCGPCIKKSKALLPVYQQFKDKGFGIFAVMTDIESESIYQELNEKYSYPWHLFSDVQNQHKVRETYGIRTRGGTQILLNKTGKIIKIDPTAEELETFLSKHL